MKKTPGCVGLAVTALLSVFIIGSASRCLADSMVDAVMENWHPAEINGRIMSVDTSSGTVIVNEIQISVVDVRAKNGERCTTRIMNAKGRTIGIDDLKKGRYVYIKAGTAQDPEKGVEYVVAKEIYLLPSAMNAKGLKKIGIPTGRTSPW